ncbi:hypothetical protein, partial [Burkholderia ubonensis]|uniref:hypothetical protein n=1 Tax=Burkholderia ubonensis TaxID=101571 RepID=UPI001E58AFD5
NVSARKPSFSAALRCQQQRKEIMNTVSQFVNNFFTNFVATAGFICFPLPRRVAVSAKEA